MSDAKKKKKGLMSRLADELAMIQNKGLSKPADATTNKKLKGSSRGKRPKFAGK